MQKPQSLIQPAAIICFYGTPRTGAGYLAQARNGRMFGDGRPVRGRSFGVALWQAIEDLRFAGIRSGVVHVVDSGGARFASTLISREAPEYAALNWQPTPVVKARVAA
jgi:hypothetical protein